MNASSPFAPTRRRAGHTLCALAAALTALAGGAALAPCPAAAQEEGDGLVFRRVHASSVDSPWFGGLPALGRFFASFTPGGDLAVYDLAEDRTEVITDHAARGDSADFLLYPSIAPDGGRIAAFWATFPEGPSGGRSENQLRVINRDGSGERTLISEPGPFWLSPLAWTPGGRSIIAQQREGTGGMAVPGALEIVEVSMDDGARRVITRLDVQAIPSLFVSPDGRYAAFGIAADDTGNRDIHAVNLTNGRTWPLISGNGEDQLMGWHPDGSAVFFYSNRELGWGIWKLPIRDGRSAGEPELVRGDVWDMAPLGFSGDQFFYMVNRASPQIRTANIDVAAGRLVTPPTMIRAPSEGWSRDPAWSPDGSYLAFLDYPAGEGWDAAHARLGIRSVHTGETRFLPFPFPSGASLLWGPETESIRVLGHRDGVRGLFRFDLQTRAVTLLREFPDPGDYSLAFSPDGRKYYFHRDRSEIWAGEMATGREELLARVEGVDRRIYVSPDGSTLMVRTGPNVGENSIVLVPTAGGEPREIWRGERVLAGGPFFHMTPDNRYVVAAEFLPPESIWRFSVDGSEEPLQIFDGERPGGLRMSPDGRRIAYWTWSGFEAATEIWVIEGLVEAGRD